MERKNKKIVAGMMAGFCVLSTQTLVQYGLLLGNGGNSSSLQAFGTSNKNALEEEMNELENKFDNLKIEDKDEDVGILDENNICNGCKYELDDEKEEATLKQCTEDVNEVIIHKYVQGKDGRQYKVTSVDAKTLCFSCSSKIQSFKVSEDNQYFKSVDGVLFDKDGKELIYYPGGKEGDIYTMPKGVEYINYWGIQHQYLRFIIIPKGAPCKEELVRVNLGDKIAEVEDGACIYDRCIYSLNDKTREAKLIRYIYDNPYYYEPDPKYEIRIPRSVVGNNGEQYEVTSMDSNAWRFSEKLQSIDADEDNQYFKSVDGVLFSKDGKKLIKHPAGKKRDTYKIPEGTKIIGKWAFDRCKNLKTIEMSNSVTILEDYAFFECDNLEAPILSDNLEIIGNFVFAGCNNFESIKIPKTVTSMGEFALYRCENLEKVFLPKSLRIIVDNAFDRCELLQHINIPKGAPCKGRLIKMGLGDKIVEVDNIVGENIYK